jgi:DNA replication protein DnaC
VRERHTHRGYLEALLAAEVDERERHAIARRLKDAHLPRVKTLDEFDFSQAAKVSATQIRELVDGGYIALTEPVVLIGDCGTGRTHLLTGLCEAACRQKRRVRFTTAAALVNELVEAKHAMQLARVLARWARYDVIAIDEVGYVPLADVGAELLFQIIADRTERGAHPDHKFAVLGTDPGDPEHAVVQGRPGSDHGSGAHHRHRSRVLSVSPHGRKAAEESLIDARG